MKSPQVGNCEDIILSNGQTDTYRAMDVSGFDPLAPWFDLGSNTGMPDELSAQDCGMYYDATLNDSLSRCGEDCSKDFDGNDINECYYYYVDTDVLNLSLIHI